MANRRVFILQSVIGTSVLASGVAMAAASMVDEADPAAKGLGYVADTARADGKKYPKHTNEQKCNNCALFQGKATDAAGGCPLFPSKPDAPKQVAGKGWCSAYAKKA